MAKVKVLTVNAFHFIDLVPLSQVIDSTLINKRKVTAEIAECGNNQLPLAHNLRLPRTPKVVKRQEFLTANHCRITRPSQHLVEVNSLS